MCMRVGVHIPAHMCGDYSRVSDVFLYCPLTFFTSRRGLSLNGKLSLLASLAGLESKKPENLSHARVRDMCSHTWFCYSVLGI